jgi:hypothetical protein
MKTWYNRIDDGEVESKKELVKDFWFYYFFSLFSLLILILCAFISVVIIEFLGFTIFFAYFTLSFENKMISIKKYYREHYERSCLNERK